MDQAKMPMNPTNPPSPTPALSKSIERKIAAAVAAEREALDPCRVRLRYLLETGELNHLTIELREAIAFDLAAAIRARGGEKL